MTSLVKTLEQVYMPELFAEMPLSVGISIGAG